MARAKERDRKAPRPCPLCGRWCDGRVEWRRHVEEEHGIDDPDDLVRD